GFSFIPQHSDARVLDQLVYKWKHAKRVISDVLIEKYDELLKTGWVLKPEEIERDIYNLFRGNFIAFLEK
ncbi:MAG TPA: glucuronate isomerase, partial [Dictyoglomaceae bacterium]|nr:glucuronate isomerase [Dictyoglomaceae bacterium]